LFRSTNRRAFLLGFHAHSPISNWHYTGSSNIRLAPNIRLILGNQQHQKRLSRARLLLWTREAFQEFLRSHHVISEQHILYSGLCRNQ
jgi:hypothetical protein